MHVVVAMGLVATVAVAAGVTRIRAPQVAVPVLFVSDETVRPAFPGSSRVVGVHSPNSPRVIWIVLSPSGGSDGAVGQAPSPAIPSVDAGSSVTVSEASASGSSRSSDPAQGQGSSGAGAVSGSATKVGSGVVSGGIPVTGLTATDVPQPMAGVPADTSGEPAGEEGPAAPQAEGSELEEGEEGEAPDWTADYVGLAAVPAAPGPVGSVEWIVYWQHNPYPGSGGGEMFPIHLLDYPVGPQWVTIPGSAPFTPPVWVGTTAPFVPATNLPGGQIFTGGYHSSSEIAAYLLSLGITARVGPGNQPLAGEQLLVYGADGAAVYIPDWWGVDPQIKNLIGTFLLEGEHYPHSMWLTDSYHWGYGNIGVGLPPPVVAES